MGVGLVVALHFAQGLRLLEISLKAVRCQFNGPVGGLQRFIEAPLRPVQPCRHAMGRREVRIELHDPLEVGLCRIEALAGDMDVAAQVERVFVVLGGVVAQDLVDHVQRFVLVAVAPVDRGGNVRVEHFDHGEGGLLEHVLGVAGYVEVEQQMIARQLAQTNVVADRTAFRSQGDFAGDTFLLDAQGVDYGILNAADIYLADRHLHLVEVAALALAKNRHALLDRRSLALEAGDFIEQSGGGDFSAVAPLDERCRHADRFDRHRFGPYRTPRADNDQNHHQDDQQRDSGTLDGVEPVAELGQRRQALPEFRQHGCLSWTFARR